MKNDSVCLEHWLASVEKNSVGEELHAPTGQLLVSIGVDIGEIHGNPILEPIETVWSHGDFPWNLQGLESWLILTSESRFRFFRWTGRRAMQLFGLHSIWICPNGKTKTL